VKTLFVYNAQITPNQNPILEKWNVNFLYVVQDFLYGRKTCQNLSEGIPSFIGVSRDSLGSDPKTTGKLAPDPLAQQDSPIIAIFPILTIG
jgi:hypothetical protein